MNISGYSNYNNYVYPTTAPGTINWTIGGPDVNGNTVSTNLLPPCNIDLTKIDTFTKSVDYTHLEQLIADGKVHAIDMSQGITGADGYTGDPTYDARLEGKEVIMTHPEVESPPPVGDKDPDGKNLISPSYANIYNSQGHATHGFLYNSRDFLEVAALKYEALEDGQMYRNSGINGDSFVKNALDFFTGGNYTDEDFDKLKDQLVDVVFELAEQLKNGEELDFHKVESTLTVAGVDTTLGEILDFQKAAYDMESVLFGSSPSYAEIGMVESMANAYGSDKGELGQMFADAMTDLCDRAATKQAATADAWQSTDLPDQYKAHLKDKHERYETITDLYSNLDTSSKESLEASFLEAQKEHEAILTQFGKDYGILASMNIDQELADAGKTFEQLMEIFDQEPENYHMR